jgi:Icc-related predicted phosphoesterase
VAPGYDASVSIYVVADLHGAVEELRRAVPRGARLLLLGDLINFIDYNSMTGILSDVFTVEAVREVVRLRTSGNLAEAGRVMRQRSAGREEEVTREIRGRVRAEYERVFARLPDPTWMILGNVDNPAIARELLDATPGVLEPDGRVVTIEEERVAFVGGALPSPLHVAGEISEEAMRAKVEGLGDADVICSHIPPAVPELCYDTRAGRPERGSKDLLRYIEDVQPRRAYFGHVHQPLLSSLHIGKTLCINVGYFRATRRAWPHRRDPD